MSNVDKLVQAAYRACAEMGCFCEEDPPDGTCVICTLHSAARRVELERTTRCVHDWKDAACGYDGPEVIPCDKTVEDCRSRFDNFERFGGFPAVPRLPEEQHHGDSDEGATEEEGPPEEAEA